MRATPADHLLRRADWRWLLPEGRAPRVICLAADDLCPSAPIVADGPADRAVGPNVEWVHMPRGSAQDGRYDMALASTCAAMTLSRARQALRADGALYVACQVRTAAAVKRLERRLQAGGFRDVQRVMRWDASDADRAWVP